MLRLRAIELGATTELVAFDLPADVLFERIRRRDRERPPIRRADVIGWHTVYEVPDTAELGAYDRSSLLPGPTRQPDRGISPGEPI